jgi:hypothetical protein
MSVNHKAPLHHVTGNVQEYISVGISLYPLLHRVCNGGGGGCELFDASVGFVLVDASAHGARRCLLLSRDVDRSLPVRVDAWGMIYLLTEVSHYKFGTRKVPSCCGNVRAWHDVTA